ncbi:MAG: (Fe-S)-binding protein [Variibacter sp.]|nr:(Fe-S)-binding protein [Variibacter sp.]
MSSPFESALAARAAAMAEACVRCGKCVDACPVVEPAGVTAETRAVIDGVLDLVRRGPGSEAARQWASACVLSGECIKACDYGVNPRFLLAMARIAMAQDTTSKPEQRRRGVENFRKVSREVTHLSRLQLSDALLARLGQGPQAQGTAPDEPPDFVFYTGCNVLKTPHIALLCLDIMDALGISYKVMGGPAHCCGVVQLRAGDVETSGRVAESTLDKLSRSKSGQVISWCPSCYVQFTETTLPAIETLRGARPFEMTPFMRFLHQHRERLRPLLREPVDMRVALHRHPGVPGVVAAVEEILRAVPALRLVDLGLPAVGLQASAMAAMPALRNELQRRELAAAREAGVDALAVIYHTDYRELCAHELEMPFRIVNVVEIVAASMGLRQPDTYKRLKLMQDVDAILEDCRDLVAQHGLDPAVAREVVAGMLKEQPLPLAPY